MEPHPIPQNVTAFQFHLVGDMTLKQFLYLAAGLSVAYLTFIFLARSLPLIAWPVTTLSSFLGVAFAFLPISDRPLDYWVGAYIKAVYSPTKRIWRRAKVSYQEESTFAKRLLIFHSALPAIQESPPPPSAAPPPSLSTAPLPTSIPTPPPTAAELPSKEELGKTVELAKQAQGLQTKIVESERQLSELKSAVSAPHHDPQTYTNQVNTILTQLQNLMLQASQIKQQLSSSEGEPVIPKAKVAVTISPSFRPKQTQVVLTSLPNVINGIVVDGGGNYLDGVVVVIYDKEGLPVRALKTNKLGQFSGATPLPNGTYTMELEKENLGFDTLQIELEGKVLPPIQISAKRMAAL